MNSGRRVNSTVRPALLIIEFIVTATSCEKDRG